MSQAPQYPGATGASSSSHCAFILAVLVIDGKTAAVTKVASAFVQGC